MNLRDNDDEYVKQLQDSVKKVKIDREMRRRYMMIEEIKKKEYNAGKAEGIIQSIIGILSAKGDISKEMLTSIESIEDIYVHEGKEITIKFKYEDEYQRAIEYIKRNKNLTLLRNEEEIG